MFEQAFFGNLKEHNCAYTGHTTGERIYYACANRKKLGKKLSPCHWLKKEAIEKFGSTDDPAITSIIHENFNVQQAVEQLGLDKQIQKEYVSMGLTEVQSKALQEIVMSYYAAMFEQLITDLVNRWRFMPRATAQRTVDILANMFLEAQNADDCRNN